MRAQSLSRRHAEIAWRSSAAASAYPVSPGREGGGFYLRCVHHKNKVLHNGAAVRADGDWVALQDGDRLIIGPCLLRFHGSDAAPPESDAPPEAVLAELTQEEERHLTERNPALRHMLGRGTAVVQDWLAAGKINVAEAEE